MQEQTKAARRPLMPGERFGRLVVVRLAEKPRRDRSYLCWCNCGVMTVVPSHALKSGNTRSCGCLKREKVPWGFKTRHGHSRWHPRKRAITTPTYNSWKAMCSRCLWKGSSRWKWYGGQGVRVHDVWVGPGGFDRFLADMGERPEGMTLDRIDPFGNYEPSNCRWATWEQQADNKRSHAVLRNEVARLTGLVEAQRKEIDGLKEA